MIKDALIFLCIKVPMLFMGFIFLLIAIGIIIGATTDWTEVETQLIIFLNDIEYKLGG